MQFIYLLTFLAVASAPAAFIYYLMWRRLFRLWEPAKITTPWGDLWSSPLLSPMLYLVRWVGV